MTCGMAQGEKCSKSSEPPLGRGVNHTVEVSLQHLAKYRLVGTSAHEERHARAKFLCVDGPEDLLRSLSACADHNGGAFDQPRTENGVRQIRFGFCH